MASSSRPWIVTPHGALQQHEENLWSVEGDIPGIPGKRRMAVARRSDGTLCFYNAIPLEPAVLAQVLSLGTPKVLIVPHTNHGIDATPFSARLGIGIYGPRRQEAKMREKFALAGVFEDLPKDDGFSVESVDGTRSGEPVAIVKSGAKTSVVFSDVVQDWSTLPPHFVATLAGFAGGPKCPPLFKLFFTADRKAMRAHLERVAGLPGLARIIPSHGAPIEVDAPGVMRKVAAGI